MALAKSVLSTPSTNTSATEVQSSRRRFLAQAAVAAAGGAIAGTIMPLPEPQAATAQTRDPILAAIESHRRAVAAHEEAVDVESALEASLPADRRRSIINVWEETIVAGDDPRWIASERARDTASEFMDDLALDLLMTKPTTVAGAEALLRYYVDGDQGLFPDAHDDGSAWTFGDDLIRNAADALGKIARPNYQIAQQLEEVLA